MAVIIVAIVFGSLIAITAIEKAFDLKKRKLEAEIRMQELRAGVAPGTYSRISKKDLKKNARNRERRKKSWHYPRQYNMKAIMPLLSGNIRIKILTV